MRKLGSRRSLLLAGWIVVFGMPILSAQVPNQANEHFATKLPGWKTDRGRIYIIYGPPDQVDNHFSAAGSESAERILGAGAIPYDWELWHYRYIDGVGKNVAIKFVDTCACGEYQIPVEKKDLKKYTPQ